MGAHPEDSGVVIATEHHDHEPDELGAGEPSTPMWLPFVGGIVFVLGVIGFVATRPPGKTAAELRKEASVAAAEIRAKREAERAPPAVRAPAMPNMPGMPNPSMPQPGRAPGKGG
jgi:hypothetical protein